MADPSEQYKASLEAVEKLLAQQKSLNQATQKLKDSWGVIATEVFKLDGAAFFKQVPLGTEDIKRLNSELKKINEEVRSLGEEFGKALDNDDNIKEFSELAKGAFIKMQQEQEKFGKGSKEAYQEEIKYLEQIRKDRKEFATLSDDDLRSIGEHLSKGGDLSEIYDQLEETSKNIIKSNSKNPDILIESERAAKDLHEQTKGIRNQLEKGTKEAFALGEGLKKAFKDNVIKEGMRSLMQFDATIHDVQKNTGIMMDSFSNSQAFASVTRNVNQFGMGTKEAGEYMKSMSNELKSTDFQKLAKATEDFAAIEGATGISKENVTGIAGELMRMGQSSEQVKDYMENASMTAQKFGVSSKRALEAISKNISKIRTMGFKGGEESLTRMAIRAEKLKMNVDEIFDVAKKARTIEGAMEMASELQLAGGSFANINPMDLLAAARNGPEELQKILTKMGGDIGKFNEKTGKYEFDAVDVDRLQMVADATGQSLDSIQNMIQSNAEDSKKLDMFQGDLSGLDELEAEMVKSGLSEMMKIGKDGKVEFNASSDMAKRMGIESLEELQGLSGEQLKNKMEADAKTLEEQNLANQDFASSLKIFWQSIQSLFNILQPVLEGLTWVIQGFTSLITGFFKLMDEIPILGTIIKWAVPLLLLFGTGFAQSVLGFITKGVGGFAKNITEVVKSKGASLFSKGKDIATDKSSDMGSKAKGPAPTVGEGLKSLAKGLKAMGGKDFGDISKGILAVALAGPAFLLFTPALPGLLVMAGVGAVGKTVTAGFNAVAKGLIKLGKNFGEVMLGVVALAAMSIPMLMFIPAVPGLLLMVGVGAAGGLITEGFKAVSKGFGILGKNITNVLMGSLAMAVIGASIIPFALALSLMTNVSWDAVLASLVFMILAAGIVVGMGLLIAGPQALLLLAGAAAMLIIAGALLVFAYAMQAMLPVMTAMQGADFSWMSNLGWNLLLAAPGLFLGGIALGLATPGLIIGSLGIMAISLAAQAASVVDWSVMAKMGGSLALAALGILAFAIAGVMLFNPIMMAGMMLMVYVIATLAAVMVPLSLSLQLGADSMTKFAIGLERLSSAADTLSDEKLAKLQKISDAMAKASAAGNVAGAMASTAEGAGGGAGGGGVRKIEVDVKLNGRELQSYIVKDTAIAK
jgi:hypothetical protein